MRDNAHGHDQLNFTDDPFRKTLIVGPNGWQLLSHVNRWLEEGPPSVGSRPPEDPAGELIFRALCWWPYVRWSPPDIHGRSISMRVLLQDERYALRNATDVVDGRKCLVLEVPNVDVFWLDAEQPSRVLRRDVYNTETGSLGARFELSEYTQYQQNVWLPGRIRNAQFDSYAHTPTLRQRRVVDATFSVRNIEINDDVDDRMFHMELPPGTVQDAAAEEQRYLKPMSDGQSDHLASIVKWGKQFYATDEMAGGGYRDVCMSGAGVVVGFSVCWLVLSITGGRAGREHTRP